MVVGPDGSVTKAYMEEGRPEYKDFENCVAKSLKTLRFGAKAGRKEVDIKMTLILK